MIKRIKELLSDSLFYGASKFLGQMMGFILLPLYTRYLSPEDYGVLAMCGIFAIILALLSNIGFESSVYRYLGFDEHEEIPTIHTASIFVAVLSVFLFSLALLGSGVISQLLFSTDVYGDFVKIGACIGLAESLKTIPFAVLRLKRRVKVVAWSSLINIVFSIGFTFFFLIVLDLGAYGALLGNLTGTIASLVLVVWFVSFPRLSNFRLTIFKELLQYALYLFPHRILGRALPYYAQFYIANTLDLRSLGLYAIALKFCVPYTLLVSIFQQSWAPYKFVVFREEGNAKDFFRNFFSVYFLTTMFIYLGLYFFADDILVLMTSNEFHEADRYIKYVAAIPLCTGLYYMLGTGVEFSKSPRAMPLISLTGVVAVVFLTYFLIPIWGVAGAAISIAGGWLVMALAHLVYARHFFKVPYQWSFIMKVVCTVILIITIASYSLKAIYLEIAYLAVFVIVLYFITPEVRSNFRNYVLQFVMYKRRKK